MADNEMSHTGWMHGIALGAITFLFILGTTGIGYGQAQSQSPAAETDDDEYLEELPIYLREPERAGARPVTREAAVVATPPRSIRSLIDTGTPWSGPR